jgi:F0F1-type ATP synthase membrane subunit b/b'
VTVSEHRDKNGKGESYWRKRAADLRLKLRDQETRRDLVVKQMNDQDQKPLSTKNKKARASLEKKKTKLDTDIARTRRALEVDLPEEARKADAYPGWIRE